MPIFPKLPGFRFEVKRNGEKMELYIQQGDYYGKLVMSKNHQGPTLVLPIDEMRSLVKALFKGVADG